MNGTLPYNQADYENDLLVKSQIERMFLTPFRMHWDTYNEMTDFNFLQEKYPQIELIITSECNLRCEYCYLHKYADDLVPPECRSHKRILENLNRIFQWWIREDFHCNLDIFTGEIWQTDFGIEVLETIYGYASMGADIGNICIPSNMSFLMSDKHRGKVQNLIDRFAAIGHRLGFSASVDGQPIEDFSRPPRDLKKIGQKDRIDFYDTMFKFCRRNGYGYHPMLAAYSIEKWKDNLLWWRDSFKKYYPDTWKDTFLNKLMMLEVRNNDWTQEKIDAFLDFQDFFTDVLLEDCFDGDVEAYTLYMLKVTRRSESMNYNTNSLISADGSMSCSMARSLCIRVGDLAIVPCHRCGYEKYVYGWFRQNEDGDITGDVKAHNVSMCAMCNYANMKTIFPHCEDCVVKVFCMRGCMGAQIEEMGDPFFRIPCVCDLRLEKTYNAMKNLDRIGGMDYLRKIVVNHGVIVKNYVRQCGNSDDAYSIMRQLYTHAVNITSIYDKMRMERGE